MGLFTTALKQGKKFADNLFDDAVVQAKQVDEVFDEAAWLERDPRPYPDIKPRDMSEDQYREYRAHIARRRLAAGRANQEGYDSLGDRIKDPNAAFDEDEWLLHNPKPYPDVRARDLDGARLLERKNWIAAKKRAKNRAYRDDHDSLGNPVKGHFDDEWIGNFHQAEWLKQNPKPEGPSTSREYHLWNTKRNQAKKRANSPGYTSLGLKEKRKHVDDDGNVIPGRVHKPVDMMSPEEYAANLEYERQLSQTPKAKSRTRKSNHKNHAERLYRDAPWSDDEGLLEVHRAAEAIELDSGVKMEVDHVLPLKGDYVSGLNVPNNLHIMPEGYNRSKGNRVGDEHLSLFPSDLFIKNNHKDHQAYIFANDDLVAQRIREKQARTDGVSDQISQDILNPRTKLGRNARKLWGDDADRYLDYYREQLNLLGIPSK